MGPQAAYDPSKVDVSAVLAGDDSKTGTQIPDKPDVPNSLRDYTAKWKDETSDSADFSDACRQYQEDMKALFPGEATARARNPKKSRTRAETRQVVVPRVFRNSQQTLAMVCPGDHTLRFKPRKEIPPMGMGGRSSSTNRDVYVEQFALTATDRVLRSIEEIKFGLTVRDWFRHGIWFRNGILKLCYQRDFHLDPLMAGRSPDAQDNLAKLQYLLTRYSRGEFSTNDAEWQEILSLKQGLVEGDEISMWQGPVAQVIPLNRFKADSRISTLGDLPNARWQGDVVLLTGAEILTRWQFEELPQPDAMGRTWKGVHPYDLRAATPYDVNMRQLTDEERKRRATNRLNRNRGNKSAMDEHDDCYFGVFECWSQLEQKIIWLVEGLDYPADEMTALKQPSGFYPYKVLNFNPQPGTWYGRSDTELQAPVQDRINRKMTDQEKARGLSTGGRGVADVSQIDGAQVDLISKLKPGEFLKLNLGGNDITKMLMWIEAPYHGEAFDITLDEEDMRFLARIPQQSMGVTDPKTTATAVNTAVAGAQIASNDKQYDGQEALKDVYLHYFQMLLQEESAEVVMRECGANALWPKVFSEADGKKIRAMIEQQVNQQVTQQLEAEHLQAQLSGMPAPPIDELAVDAQIQTLTEQFCLQHYGFPEPLTREGLFKRVQVSVNLNLNGAMDRERRVMQITQLLAQLVPLGARINLEPVSRLLASLMGEDDELSQALKPDPNQLIGMLDEIAQQDPSTITPEAAAVLAKLGGLATAYLRQVIASQGPNGAAGGPGGGAPPASPGAPAPGGAAAASGAPPESQPRV